MASERSTSSGQRSDMVTGATRQPISGWENGTKAFDVRLTYHRYNTRSSAAHTPYRRLHVMDRDDASDDDSDVQTNQVVTAITDLPRKLHSRQAKTKRLQTQMPVFKKQQKNYKDFGHLLLNCIRPFQNNLTEKEKQQFFISFLRDYAFEFWQTLHINPETTVQDVLTIFRKDRARNFKEFPWYKCVQPKYDPQAKKFNCFTALSFFFTFSISVK